MLLVSLLACGSPSLPLAGPAASPPDAGVTGDTNPYTGLRNIVFSMPAPAEDGVYAVLTDWNVGDGVATILGARTGEASLYTSTGGGVLGMGSQPEVRDHAVTLCTLADRLHSQATPTTDTTTLPAPGHTRMLLLSRAGVRAFEADVDTLSPASPAGMLFTQVNALLTAINAAAPQ